MRTFPVYEATFSGSNDHMAMVTVRLAAPNLARAISRFREWDECDTGTCGMVGNVVYRAGDGGFSRPVKITRDHVRPVKDIRATREDWFSTR